MGGVTLGIVIAHCFIVIFSHLEVRYFYFIKMYSVFAFILLSPALKEVILPKMISSKFKKMCGEDVAR